MTESQIPRLVSRGFLIWSWLGLLSAYVATSALFVSQLYINWREGFQAFRFSSSLAVTFSMAQLLPVYTLVFAWLAFYRYSNLTFAVAVEGREPSESPDLLPQFRSSLQYLMFSWLAALAMAFVPVVAQLAILR